MAHSQQLKMVRRLLLKALGQSLTKVESSRRDCLLGAAAIAVSAYLTRKNDLQATPVSPANQDTVVIIGGGLAGLTTAYYLKKAGIKYRIYEAASRLGGRIFTEYGFNQEGMFCERGGELIDSLHLEIQELAKELGLEVQRLGDSLFSKKAYYFDHQWYSEESVITGLQKFAQKIASDLQLFSLNGRFALPTYKEPISERVKALDQMTLQTYLDSAADICPPWIRELLRVAYTGEYGLEAHDQSSINLITMIESNLGDQFEIFGDSDELFRIKGGNSKLIDRLGEVVDPNISVLHRLDGMAKNPDGSLQLELQHRSQKVTIKAAECVLTIPFTVLRSVNGLDKIGLSPKKFECINKIGYGTNSKLMLGFTEAYWRQKNPRFVENDGYMFTDLGMQSFWDTSRKQAGKSGILTNFLGGKAGENISLKDVDGTLKKLNLMFPGITALYDQNRVLQVWPQVETAKGSYICFKPGQYCTLGGSFSEVELDGRLYFAGEHTGDQNAGYMNGAVRSGIRAATEIINIVHVISDAI